MINLKSDRGGMSISKVSSGFENKSVLEIYMSESWFARDIFWEIFSSPYIIESFVFFKGIARGSS